MKLALVAVLTVAATATFAQQPAFTDPANLRGERVAPKTGRELPVDQPEAQGGHGLEQTLRRLGTRASLMLIVAHPDDEDGGMLTTLSRGLGARVCTLTLNRGEGGQNAVTGDFEDALGLIRTQELLSADRYLGADQMFGTEVDFGFSKTKEESFSKWTHERVLYDAVRAVRLYRPLVIASVFIGGVTDGHGQHQVSGEIAQEVFNAAGDPKVFPELTREGILPWRPLKVYARVPSFAITGKGLFDYATNQYAPARFTNYVTGETTNTPPSIDVTVHEGQTDALLSGPAESPRSYVQFARLGLALQKTQIGPGARLAAAGAYDVGYHRYGSRLPHQADQETSFFQGIDTSLNGIAQLSNAPPKPLVDGLHSLNAAVAALQHGFDAAHPGTLAPQLAAAQDNLGRMLYALEDMRFPGKADVLHELRVKQVQLNEALVDALALHMSASPASGGDEHLAGTPVAVHTDLSTTGKDMVGVFSVALENASGRKVAERTLAMDAEPVLRGGQPQQGSLTAPAGATGTISRPYFFRTNSEQAVYQLLDPTLRNAPASPPSLTAWYTLRYHGVEVQAGTVVGADLQPLRLVPALSVAVSTHAQPLVTDHPSFQLGLLTQPAAATISDEHIAAPDGWRVQAVAGPENASGSRSFEVGAPLHPEAATLLASARLAGGGEYKEGFRVVGYGDLPRTDYFEPASTHVVPVTLALPVHRRIGYLAGTGDALPQMLAAVGLPVTMLTVADLRADRLAQFDTVVLGVRTYNAHPELHGAPTQALLAFAHEGGNVLLQYQSPEFTGADAPYPLSLGVSEKVVDETAPVQILVPDDRLFHTPNELTQKDFGGWNEERGHGFLESWDSHYLAPTETHDPGQAPQRGGLITTQLGGGHWTYCAFALYRQLPEAIPGAFRIFANLLALADAKQP